LQTSAQSLLALINDILDFSKIEAGHLKIENIEFNLEELFFDLAKLNNIRNTSKNVEFLYDMGSNVPTVLMGDPFRINQILTNLLSNAIKFTSQGNIIIKVSVVEPAVTKKNHLTIWLIFEVIDTGKGIAASQLDKLYRGLFCLRCCLFGVKCSEWCGFSLFEDDHPVVPADLHPLHAAGGIDAAVPDAAKSSSEDRSIIAVNARNECI